MRSLTLLGLATCAILCTPSLGFSQRAVICEMNGRHEGDPDRRDDDVDIVRESISQTYPHLPPHLRSLTDHLTFVVEHDDVFIRNGIEVRPTKMFGGWSAEDDKDYRYPDRRLYPGGTIKVNLTEVFVQQAAVCRSALLQSDEEKEGCWEGVRGIVAHEILHAYQYHTGPVRDLSKVATGCPHGLCSKKGVAATKRKIAYEREAWVFGESFHTVNGMVAYNAALRRVWATSPELLAVNLETFRLYLGHPVKELTPEQAAKILAHKDFGPGSKEFYEGQYRLPELAWQAHRLRKQQKHLSPANLARRHDRIMAAWDEATMRDRITTHLVNTYPHLEAVVKRFRDDIVATIP